MKVNSSHHSLVSWSLIVCLTAVMVVSSGCEPLRKKFTRKKKKEVVTQEVPILEPIEYPKRASTPQELYKVHYSLWQIWHDDLVRAVVESDSQKKQLYDLEQELDQVRALLQFLPPDRQEKLNVIVKGLEEAEDDIRKSNSQGINSILKVKLESIGRQIRSDFKFSRVSDRLVDPSSEEKKPE